MLPETEVGIQHLQWYTIAVMWLNRVARSSTGMMDVASWRMLTYGNSVKGVWCFFAEGIST